jgi:hypothetical protein
LTLYKKAEWTTSKKRIQWSAVLALEGFSFLSLIIILSQTNGVFSPDTLVGIPMRIGALGYCVWLIVIAKQAINLKTRKS